MSLYMFENSEEVQAHALGLVCGWTDLPKELSKLVVGYWIRYGANDRLTKHDCSTLGEEEYSLCADLAANGDESKSWSLEKAATSIVITQPFLPPAIVSFGRVDLIFADCCNMRDTEICAIMRAFRADSCTAQRLALIGPRGLEDVVEYTSGVYGSDPNLILPLGTPCPQCAARSGVPRECFADVAPVVMVDSGIELFERNALGTDETYQGDDTGLQTDIGRSCYICQKKEAESPAGATTTSLFQKVPIGGSLRPSIGNLLGSVFGESISERDVFCCQLRTPTEGILVVEQLRKMAHDKQRHCIAVIQKFSEADYMNSTGRDLSHFHG